MIKYDSIVKNVLASRHSKNISDFISDKTNKAVNKKYVSAAILFPLIERENNINVILTKRSEYMSDHPGQVCFPGGKFDLKDKTMENCAKREAMEEIGLKSDHIRILGELDKCFTGTGFKITPVIAAVSSNYMPLIDKREVSEVFEVPLKFLINSKNRHIVHSKYAGIKYSFYEYYWKNKKIWGSTAKIIVNFCDIVKKDLNV